MYSPTLSLTLALDGSEWSTPSPGRFTPGKDPVPIVQEAEWVPGSVWTGAENLAPPPPGFDPRTVRPVPSCYTDSAIPATMTREYRSPNFVYVMLQNSVYTPYLTYDVTITRRNYFLLYPGKRCFF